MIRPPPRSPRTDTPFPDTTIVRSLPPAPPRTGTAWPACIEADFHGCTVGIARTQPAFQGLPEIREVEALFDTMIAAAERTIYIENQFVTSARIARRIA